jgi:hypothetical protein
MAFPGRESKRSIRRYSGLTQMEERQDRLRIVLIQFILNILNICG